MDRDLLTTTATPNGYTFLASISAQTFFSDHTPATPCADHLQFASGHHKQPPFSSLLIWNVGVNQKSLGRAGSKRWLGKRPVVRGVVMNHVDHPHGGGEGRDAQICLRPPPATTYL
ncbi:hypothetical protein Ccrd_001846 [Cynara cardunculus var. scolymus]|uniref:Large ribosomal subunit protein uL2 C-terminal domain-containing protein n=1 Tax=Cynara cardunculus var. scolymus TaxID=59895 RepID=A0A103XSG3_CYNCS|nr:hypothetical protein Ccrd_001846 [Cynara cardunculus var. scolymus]